MNSFYIMIERVYVLSHTDLDGYFSAGLVEFLYPRLINEDAVFTHKSWTYGRDLPSINYIKKNFDAVFVVDLCPSFEFMYTLWDSFRDNLIWIDHHVKPDNDFLEKFHELHNDIICGERETEEHRNSAAALVYKYFYGEYTSPLSDLPSWLRYISDFDCWNHQDDEYWNNKVMPMFSYLKNIVTSPQEAVDYINKRDENSQFFDNLVPPTMLKEELKLGKIMYDCTKASYRSDAKHGFERTFAAVDGETNEIKTYKAWICNTQNRSSVLFEDMPNKNDFDVFVAYHFNGKKYLYSMYTFKEDIFCNKMNIWKDLQVVLSFNGHKDAAGANSEKFVFA